MGIRIEERTIVYHSYNMRPIEPCYFFPDRAAVREYVEDNPFPESEENHYSEEDLIHDTQSTGMWTLPDDLTSEQKEYIVVLVNNYI